MTTGKTRYALLIILSAAWLFGSSSRALATEERSYEFEEFAEQGFGDRQNTKAWAMKWWGDHLYVGTARAHLCMDWAGLSILGLRPGWVYPPEDPDLECTEDYRDLPLRAEIWRYSMIADTWERVFVSELITNPADPSRETARDAGFRNMILFPEPGGGEALYAAGITSESLNPGMPPPRLLRTTNGVDWNPVPQEPGTVFGDLGRGQANLRAAEVYKGRFYIVAGNLRGTGRLLEASNPAGGNDAFRFVTPEDMQIFELMEYEGWLYLGLGTEDGYQVVKTDAEGPLPYELTPVVESGGGVPFFKSAGVASMHVSKGRLFVGTDKPAELIRINPDDTWDLIIGKPRWAKGAGGELDLEAWKEPLSGFDSGFDYFLTNHFHRMVTHDGQLFLSTNDATGFMKIYRFGQPFLNNMGFDLYASSNGVEYSALTLTGFDKPFDIVMRVWASTPQGLFGGTSNAWYGLRMYRARPVPMGVPAPRHLTSESVDGSLVLNWESVSGASLYRIYRRKVGDGPEFVEIGTTGSTFFNDPEASGGTTFHYYVVSELTSCCRSAPSNLARWPILLKPMTARKLSRTVKRWNGGSRVPVLNDTLDEAAALLAQGESDEARALLLSLDGFKSSGSSVALVRSAERDSSRPAVRARRGSRRGAPGLVRPVRRSRSSRGAAATMPDWRMEDFRLLLGRLLRRFQLVEAGILTPQNLS